MQKPAAHDGPGDRSTSLGPPIPAFIIVGTPRSGTTLVQRLAAELPRVRVPRETRFFHKFRALPWVFPLEGDDLRKVLGECATIAEVPNPDIDEMFERLGGRANGPLSIWAAVIRESAGEDASLYGEKSPPHLWWWRPLSVALPSMRIVAVVRDPRAVIASWGAVPWGPEGQLSTVQLAQRWVLDQREVERARSTLGRERCLVLRYEDAVTDPDGARRRIADLLGVGISADDSLRTASADELFMPRETWKARAVGEITPERIHAWKGSLPPRDARVIEAICRRAMIRFGYPVTGSPLGAWALRVGLAPRSTLRRARLAWSYRQRIRSIERTRLS